MTCVMQFFEMSRVQRRLVVSLGGQRWPAAKLIRFVTHGYTPRRLVSVGLPRLRPGSRMGERLLCQFSELR